MVGGSANPLIYNQKEVEDALKSAYDRKVQVSVAVQEINFDKDGKNVIDQLAKDGKINLYIPEKSKISNHFKVIDDNLVYSEKAHNKEETKREYEIFKNIPYFTDKFNKRFEEITFGLKPLYFT